MAQEVRPPLEAVPQFDHREGEDTGAAIRRWQRNEEEFIAELQKKCRENGWPGTIIGEMLRWQRGDGYAVYMVWREKPLQIFRVEIGDAWQIEASTIRGLTLRDAKEMVAREKSLRALFDKPQEFYDTLKVGDIVHYSNGFAQFVRCEVVGIAGDMTVGSSELKAGDVALRPIALVGEVGRRQREDGSWVHGWASYDLPRYMPDGTVHYGYHVERVMKGDLMRPSASNLWEYPEFHDRKRLLDAGIDPTKMKPISLDPPPMDAEMKRRVPLVKALAEIRSKVESADKGDTLSLQAALVDIHNIAGRA